MIGEVSIGGVYFPSLLMLALVALAITSLAVRLMSIADAYRLFSYRPLIDLALFIIILWTVCIISAPLGLRT